MAKIKKKGTSGSSQNYYTRSQAVRRLQIPLSQFRRLCILKGIYPREPRSKKRVSKSSTPSTTFYYAKDIQYLLHEPLLAKLRDQKALEKKIRRALGKNEVGDAVRLERQLGAKTRLRLDHVIKERYPTFIDALRDLDDALSMLYLFASLPSTASIPAQLIARCQRLTLEWEHYLIQSSGTLRKSFLSIKGIYYQATIQGQDILWLAPYRFVQRTDEDVVDFRIMGTFVQFYCALLGFVNFRLFTSVGLVYPPRFDIKAEERGAELGAFQLEGRNGEAQGQIEDGMDVEANERAQKEADRLLSLPAEEEKQETDGRPEPTSEDLETTTTTALDTFAPIDSSADTLPQPSSTSTSAQTLFEPFTFFLSRETPRRSLEFILKAFGCKRVGWQSVDDEPGSYCTEDDTRITHQVVDRPDLPLPSPPETDDEARVADADADVDGLVPTKSANERVPGRIYVQPQWVWDSINAGSLQRADLYAPGATLPPHLSPWVKARKGVYDPTVPLADQPNGNGVDAEDELDVDEEGSEGEEVDGVRGDAEAREMEEELEQGDESAKEEEDGGMDVQLAASASEDDESDAPPAMDDEFGGFSSDSEPEIDDSARQAQAELEAEMLGQPLPTSTTEKKKLAKAKLSREQREAQEDIERRKMMMPRRKRKMYEKMVYSNARRDEESERLRAKRRRIEKAGGK